MNVTWTHAVIVMVVVAGGAVGASSVADLGDANPVIVEGAEATEAGQGDAAFEVRATLNNTDAENATRVLELVVEPENGSSFTVAERTVTLSPTETREVTLSAPADALRPGRYNYTLADETGTLAAGTVSLDPSEFRVSTVDADPVVRGEMATVTASIRNRGDFRGIRTANLRIDRNGDGTFDDGETVATKSPALGAGDDASIDFRIPTDGLAPGTYAYRVETSAGVREGTLVVRQPATIRITGATLTTDAVRGERFEGEVNLTNVGDVAGSETVRLDGPDESFDRNQTLTLDGNETATVNFTAATGNLTRGNYSVGVTTANDSVSKTLRVRESHLAVDRLDTPDSADVDDTIVFEARVWNIGDAATNETVEHRIDLDDDDDPETVTANATVDLEPDERTTVSFAIADDDRDRFTDYDLLGTHVHGVYTADDNATDVVVIRDYQSDSDGGSSSSDSSNDEPETVSKDAITQEKYGLDYDEVSAETQEQVDEIYERQPFADGLVITEVLTREEIARQEFGLDVKRNDAFNFSAIDVETQQEIEAVFDDQFESDEGDRIESWDELAREQFDSEYEALDEEQKETIREEYRAQFDD